MTSKKLPNISDQKKKDWLLLILGIMDGKAGIDMSKQAFDIIIGIVGLFALLFAAILVGIVLKLFGAI